MSFPPPDIFDRPQYNAERNYATSQPRVSSPSTPSPPPSRRRQMHSDAPRSRTISVTAAARRSDVPTEFYVPVEVYLSPKASVTLRKVCSSLPSPRLFDFPSVKRLMIGLLLLAHNFLLPSPAPVRVCGC
jgi:hypothetical protein